MRGFHGSKAGRVSIRVHFNQLALFPDDPIESTAKTIAEIAHDGNDIQDGARREDPQTLAGALPAYGAGPGAEESAGSVVVRDAREDGRPDVRTRIGTEDGSSGGVGTDPGGMGVAPGGEQAREQERGHPAVSDIEIADIEPEAAAPSRDFRIIEADRIGQGG